MVEALWTYATFQPLQNVLRFDSAFSGIRVHPTSCEDGNTINFLLKIIDYKFYILTEVRCYLTTSQKLLISDKSHAFEFLPDLLFAIFNTEFTDFLEDLCHFH